MGGDHKCPVCQATFTRPQHVARHMRSHTGDRPYKCQHCGDQFARSDLLSRHVNKCHAGEKNPSSTSTSTTAGKRKGVSSATRATTSKQACDQCVTSSLPCDGCNPCAKCVQRKCRCTYVKFHRQTAPIGPGHNPNPTGAAPARGAMPAINGLGVGVGVNGLGMNGLGALPGVLPPGVGVGGVGLPPFQQTMHLAHHPQQQQQQQQQYLYGTNADEFLLNPPPTTAQQAGMYTTQFTFSPVYTQGQGQGSASPTTHSQSDSEDYASKYRANQAELFRSRNDWNSWSGSESESELPGAGRGSLDKDMQAVLARQLYSQHEGVGYGYYRGGGGGGERGSGEDSGTGSASSSSVNLSLDGHGHGHGHGTAGRSGAGGSYREYLINHHNTNAHQRHPSSSSSASPPLSISQTSQSSRPGTSHSQHPQHAPNTGEGGFSSAFGLMSLDDPNVLAGLANDGQPFFSDVMDSLGVPGAGGDVDDNTTPMPRGFDNPNGHVNHLVSVSGRPSTSSGYTYSGVGGAAQTPGSREQETRELREFWKAYMRTPLTGPQGAPAGLDVNMLSPGPSYRRQRVSSLPSAKTPTMDDRVGYILPSTTNNSTNNNANGNGAAAGGYGYTKSQSNPNTSIILSPPNQQAGVGNADDLRSYEAAVLARKAPTNLNLVPRNRRKPTLPPSEGGQGQGKVTFAPGSDGGVNGVNGTGAAVNGGGGNSPGKRRPSFKRLASQTLEPENSKRWRDGSEDPDDGDDEGDDDADEGEGEDEGSVGSTSVSPQPLQQQTTIGRKSDPHNRSTYHHQPQFGFPVGGQQHEFALGLVGGGGGGGYPSAAAAPM